MHSFYMDASSLAKRYVPEKGSPLVDEILDKVPGHRIYVLSVGTGEVVSILVRKKNAGVISDAYFGQAMLNFETELVQSALINKLPVSFFSHRRPFDQLHGCNHAQIGAGYRPHVTGQRRRPHPGRFRPASSPCRPGRRAGHVRPRKPGSGGTDPARGAVARSWFSTVSLGGQAAVEGVGHRKDCRHAAIFERFEAEREGAVKRPDPGVTARTYQHLPEVNGHWSYPLPIKQYNKLRMK